MPMTKRASPTLLLLLAAFAVNAAEPDDDDDAVGSRKAAEATGSASPAGHTSVHLSTDRQTSSGLVVEALTASRFRSEIAAFGKVLDVRPLLDLRVRYRAARADAQVTAATLALAEKTRKRTEALHQADVVAGRELARAEAEYQAALAKDDSAKRLIGEILREAQQAWGDELAQRALQQDAALFEDILSHRRALILLALPAAQNLPASSRLIKVSRDGQRDHAVDAELLAPAPLADEWVQGETYFAQTAAPGLRAGMRLNAWVPASDQGAKGVALPRGAVVWHAGQAWTYRQTGADRFERVALHDHQDMGSHWFVSQGLSPGDRIVTVGAQMLLSEEQRGRIPDDD